MRPTSRRVRALIIEDQRALVEPGRRLLTRHGIAVREGAPSDALDRLLRRGRQRRAARDGRRQVLDRGRAR
jgi:hypothetical protein